MSFTNLTFAYGSVLTSTKMTQMFDNFGYTPPSGVVAYTAANAAPTGWLKCNGAIVSRSTYADLFTAIGTTYGAGDGSTTFGLPELRGEFIRSWDDARGIDSGRAIGSAQADELKSHTHTIPTYQNGATNGTLIASITTAVNYTGQTSGSTGGAETRPRNVALLAIIKY